jgi:hypothetical protein
VSGLIRKLSFVSRIQCTETMARRQSTGFAAGPSSEASAHWLVCHVLSAAAVAARIPVLHL